MASIYNENALWRGQRALYDFHSWRLDNPQAWELMEHMALDAASHGRRVGAQQLVEAVRRRDLVDERGRACRVNNDWSPIIARHLILLHPWTRPYFELRASVYDVLVLGMANEDGEGE